jgi:serine/tyrosine/threonine adenylyltransferase
MQSAEVDMTIFFRRLATGEHQIGSGVDRENGSGPVLAFADAYYDEAKASRFEGELRHWLERYQARVARDGSSNDERRGRMNAVNPVYVLRNYLAQEAIDRAEQGDDQGIQELLNVMRDPYNEQPGAARFAVRRPDWARQRAGCSMLSCSS